MYHDVYVHVLTGPAGDSKWVLSVAEPSAEKRRYHYLHMNTVRKPPSVNLCCFNLQCIKRFIRLYMTEYSATPDYSSYSVILYLTVYKVGRVMLVPTLRCVSYNT